MIPAGESVIAFEIQPQRAVAIAADRAARPQRIGDIKVQVDRAFAVIADRDIGIDILGQVFARPHLHIALIVGADIQIVQTDAVAQIADDSLAAAPGQNGDGIGQLRRLKRTDIIQPPAEQQLRQNLFLRQLGRGFEGHFGIADLSVDDDPGGDAVLIGLGDKADDRDHAALQLDQPLG